MLGQCGRSGNPIAWQFLLKRPYSSRNNFHALEQSVFGRSTLVQRLNKILFRPNGNISVQALFPKRNFATSSDEKNTPGPDKGSKGEAQKVNEDGQRVGRIELVDRTIDVSNVERSREFIVGSEEKLDSDEPTKMKIAWYYFVQISVGTAVGLVIYYTYSANMKTFVDKVDLELKVLDHEYGCYLDRKTYPFEDFIEKLLKSGNVKRIIHFPVHKKMVVVVSPGLNIEGLPTGKEAIPLHLFDTYAVHALKPAGVAREIRRLEKQIGNKSSGAVPIEVVGYDAELPWYSMPAFVFIFGIAPFLVAVLGRKVQKHGVAKALEARKKPF
ncbi:hypothetical protein Ddc_19653 [Ditylenchus destructor]|nr:hypothetical protein Ddc_19653 [Ditylenchus destructor]